MRRPRAFQSLFLLHCATMDPMIIRLLTCLVLAYPLAALARLCKTKFSRQLLLMSGGLALYFYFARLDIIHSLATSIGTWLLMHICAATGNRKLVGSLSLLLNTAYLFIGYWATATTNYDICWTTVRTWSFFPTLRANPLNRYYYHTYSHSVY